MRKIAREEHEQRPIETNLKAPIPGRELEKINATPNKPCDEAGQMEPEQIRHRRMAPNRTELA